MNNPHDRYLDTALDELFHGGPDDDLPERILSAGKSPELQIVAGTKPRRRWLWLQAASVVIAVGLIALLLIPRDESLPETVAAAGEYSVSDGEVSITDGWYVLNTGSPVVTDGQVRIESIIGRMVVKVGEIPDETELAAQDEWLRQNGVEEDMKGLNWIKAGGLAICLLAGTAVVDGNPLQAQEAERRRVEELERELEEAREDLRRAERGETEDEEEHEEEHEEWSAEQLESEINEAKRRLDELELELRSLVLNMEDVELSLEQARVAGKEELVEELEEELEALEEEDDELEAEMFELRLHIEVSELELQIHEKEVRLDELESKLDRDPDNTKTARAIRETEVALEELRLEMRRLHEELAEHEHEHEEDEEEDASDALEEMIDRLEDELDELRDDPKENAERIANKERAVKSLREALAALETEDDEDEWGNEVLHLALSNIPLHSIFELIADDLDIDIEVEDSVPNKKASCEFDGETLREAIEHLCEKHGLEFEVDDDEIIIRKAERRR